MMNSRLRLHIAMDGKIVNTHPIHNRSGTLYKMSINRDLTAATIKDENDCVIVQVVGNTVLNEILQVLVNYLVNSLDVELPVHVSGESANGLTMLAPSIQTITCTPAPTMGHYKLQYGVGGPKTVFIEWDATDAEIEAALRQIPGLEEMCMVDRDTLTPDPAVTSPTLPLLGTAANYAILSKAGISSTGATAIVGDVGISPAAAGSITGFALALDGGGAFATSSLVTGEVYASDYSGLTPGLLTTAVLDMEAAYTATAALTPTSTELGAGNISGMTLAPGVYKWTSGLIVNGLLTLTGNSSDTYVFQVDGTMDIGIDLTPCEIFLPNGQLPQNIYWHVAGATTIYPSAVMKGIILSATSVAMQNGATLDGRLLVQTAATLIGNTISEPIGAGDQVAASFGDVFYPETLIVTDSTMDSTCEVNHMVATQMAFTTQPSASVENVVFSTQPVVTIKDAAGHRVTSGPDSTALVTITLQSGTGALTGTTSMLAVAGVANFAGKGLKVSTTGNKVLRATKADTTGVGGTASVTTDTSTLVISAAAAGPTLPSLGTSSGFRILAKSGISTTGATAITGDLGISPAAAASITGFGLVLDGGGAFSTSSLVTGNIYASDYGGSTPGNLTTAVSNMEAAYTATAGVSPDVTELGAGNISGMSLAAGTYKWSTGLIINGNLTLTGGAADTYIFQIAGTLGLGPDLSPAAIVLSGGALPENIYWQVAGATTLYPGSIMKGTILSATNVAMQTGATHNGRLLVQTAATLDANTIAG